MRRTLARFATSRRANAAVEFAVVLPVLLLFVGGIVEFGRAFQTYNAVNRLATRYAISWADCSDYPAGTCSTELALYASPIAMKNLVPQLTNTVQLRMFQVTISNASVTTINYAYPLGASLSTSEQQAATTSIGAGQTGVVVTVNYSHTLMFFASLMSPFLGSSRTFTYTVAQRKS